MVVGQFLVATPPLDRGQILSRLRRALCRPSRALGITSRNHSNDGTVDCTSRTDNRCDPRCLLQTHNDKLRAFRGVRMTPLHPRGSAKWCPRL